MRCHRAVPGLLLTIAMVLASGFGPAPASARQATPTSVVAVPAPVVLRVMTFNVWLGGGQVDFAKVVEAIQAADADVVGLQEAEAHTREIAAALGWRYADERLQVISRYPLVDPPGGDGRYTFVMPRPGEVVAVANVHLPSDPYGPDALLAGSPPDEVMTLEAETRLAPLQEHLAVWSGLIDDGIPVVLTGDFNTPSHLDERCCGTVNGEPLVSPLAWPVAAALAEAGLVDTFRAAHPDSAVRPGVTWTPGYPHPVVAPDVALDRIDWVLAAGDVEVLGSEIVGEAGNPDVDIAVMPFPSDHRGVVSALRVIPGPAPLLVAVAARAVLPGDEIVVRYHAPGEEGDRIALVPAGGDAAEEALMSLPPQEATRDGVVVFGSGVLSPGAYEAVLTGGDGGELARIPFLVRTPGAAPALMPAQSTFAAGEDIAIAWDHAPGYKWDWIGIYAAGDADLSNYLAFRYTAASFSGEAVFTAADFGAVLPPGEYEARLMRDDGYVILAAAPFTVADGA